MTDYKGMFIDDSEKDGKLYSKILNTLKQERLPMWELFFFISIIF